jgi:hypothetical protein
LGNDFSFFSRFSPFSLSLRHYRVFDHFVSLTLIGSRLSFDFEERTGNLDFFTFLLFLFFFEKCHQIWKKEDSKSALKRNFEIVGNSESIRL